MEQDDNMHHSGDEEISIRFERKGNTDVTLYIAGEINFRSDERLIEAVNELLNGEFKRVTFDLSETRYIDSSGMGVLVRIKHVLNGADMDLVLTNVSELIMDTFGVTKLTRVFQII